MAPLMPDTRNPISLDVPAASTQPEAQGAGAQALAQLGQTGAELGLHFLGEVKRTEAISASSKQHYQDLLDSDAYMQRLKLTSPDGYMYDDQGNQAKNADGSPRSITQEFQEWADNRYKQSQMSMPSAMAQEEYTARALPDFTRNLDAMRSDQLEKMIQNTNQVDAETDRKIGDNLTSFPDVSKLYQYANDRQLDTQSHTGRLWSAPFGQEKTAKRNAEFAELTIKGAYNQVVSNVRQKIPGYNQMDAINNWRQILAGEDRMSRDRAAQGLPTISDMLGPDKKAALDLEFAHLYETAKGHELTDYHTRLSATQSTYRMGAGKQADMDLIKALGQGLVKGGHYDQASLARDFSELELAKMEGDKRKSLAFTLAPYSQQTNIIKSDAAQIWGAGANEMGAGPGNRVLGAPSAEQYVSTMSALRDKLESEKQADWAGYIETYHPGVARLHKQIDFSNPQTIQPKFVQPMLAESRNYHDNNYAGAQNWRVISKADSKTLGAKLDDPSTPDPVATQGIRALVASYGKDYPELIHEMVKDGSLSQKWEIAALQPTYQGTADVVSSIRGGANIKKAFETVAGANNLSEKDFAAEVYKQTTRYQAWNSQANPGSTQDLNISTANVEAVKNKAMTLYTQSNGSMSPADAVSAAFQPLIGEHIDTRDVGGGFLSSIRGLGKKSILGIPNAGDGHVFSPLEKNQIEQFAQDNRTVEFLKSTKVLVPPKANGDPSDFVDQTYNQMANTGRWDWDKTRPDGLVYWYRDRKSGKDVGAFVTDQRGKRAQLYIPFSQILKDAANKPEPKPAAQFIPRIATPTAPWLGGSK